MKNVKASQLKKCIFLVNNEFEDVLAEIYPDDEVEVNYDADGLSVYLNGDSVDSNHDFLADLAKYFGVDEVTSIHSDDWSPVGIWIAFTEKGNDREGE